MKTFYEILGIRRTATPEQVTKAYRKLAVKFHPDVANGDKDAATKKFHEVQEAYDVLSDPDRRKLYDETGSTVPPGRKQDAVMKSLLNLQRRVMEAVRAVADAIRELKRVPSGVLYSAVMSKLSLESYEKIIGTLKGAGLVREEFHELIWVEPKKQCPVCGGNGLAAEPGAEGMPCDNCTGQGTI